MLNLIKKEINEMFLLKVSVKTNKSKGILHHKFKMDDNENQCI